MIMKLADLEQEIQKDIPLDQVNLDRCSLDIPQLHGKYLSFLIAAKKALAKLDRELKVVYRRKWEYYTGKLDDKQLQELGWEVFPFKILRTDLNIYLESDTDLCNYNEKIEEEKLKIQLLEETLKMISNRHWTIRNAIEWRKFVNGS